MNKKNVVMVGYGYWGRNIARVFNDSPEFVLSGIVESDTSKHEEIKKKYPLVEIYEYFDTLKNEEDCFDVVAIVTPPNTHYNLCKQALQWGYDVWVTKPFVPTLKQAKELYALAAKQKKTIFVDYTFIFNSNVNTMQAHLAKVGKVKQISSYRMNWGLYNKDSSAVQDLMPHDLSIINHLFRDNVKGKLFTQSVLNKDVIDNAQFLGKLSKSDIKVFIQNSWCSPTKVRLFTVLGEHGALVFDDTQNEKIKFYDKSIIETNGRFIYEEKPTLTFQVSGQEALATEMKEYAIFLSGDQVTQKYYNRLNLDITANLQYIVEQE